VDPRGGRVLVRRGREDLGGELAVHGVQVVAERRPRHRLPAVVARQGEDPLHHGRQTQPLPEREVHPRDRCRVVVLALGRRTECHLDDAEEGVRRIERRDPGRQLLGHLLVHESVAAAVERLQLGAGHQRGQVGHQRLDRTGEEVHRALAVQRGPTVVDQPATGPLDQRAHLDPHPGLHVGVQPVVVATDLLAQRQRAEDLPGDEVRPGQLGGRGSGLAGQPRPVGHAGTVDQVVDHLGHDDLAAQRVPSDLVGEPLADLLGEVGDQVDVEVRVVGQVRGDQLVGQHDLGPRQQDAELGHGEGLAALEPPAYLA
jgi:hypothetical protein